MNKQELDEIRQRVEAASKGPWQQSFYNPPPGRYRESDDNGSENTIIRGPGRIGAPQCNPVASVPDVNNREFIINALTDIPKLLAYIDELEARCENRQIQ